MKKIAIKAVAAAVLTVSLTGCIGQMATSGAVMKLNLSAVDNRYARAGLYVLMSPVYGVAATADLFIFNTIEFWTGTNPISGKSPALADTPMNAVIKINQNLSSDLTTAPIKISSADVKQLNEKSLEMSVAYADGSVQTLRGEKDGEMVNFYLNNEFITSVAVAELNEYAANRV
ncbi:DUF3332 domain-containing protein [Enterovibrio nigricans]|uniref:DUF3332 domain-containing protein n=1 Tax=Enterovibrio nigricans DSM 22720 TaxID=1121868 RepID=A0A1T4VW57_9GAMM|nr:DUF3332 domain-containing protein [Enterovibrio nigricans]PKF48769.1 DUF3332 domain-containing protein [Enterovibrio nigricans]SKA69223.1 protein of unknown function [Enterovibrio nigricans DSM 22720]